MVSHHHINSLVVIDWLLRLKVQVDSVVAFWLDDSDAIDYAENVLVVTKKLVDTVCVAIVVNVYHAVRGPSEPDLPKVDEIAAQFAILGNCLTCALDLNLVTPFAGQFEMAAAIEVPIHRFVADLDKKGAFRRDES